MAGRTCVRTAGSYRRSKYSLRVVSSGATNATGHARGSASEAARAGLRRMPYRNTRNGSPKSQNA
jgi:hypothetical protein